MVKVLFTIILFATNLFFSNGQGAELVWAKHMGGTGNDYGYSIAVDDHGNVYTVGKFRNTSDFDPGSGIYNLTSFGNNDIFVSKLDSLGNFIWAKQVGGTGNDGVSHSITFDESGNVYIIGDFEGTCDLDPGSGTYNLTSLGGRDIFILKLDAMGNFVWAKQMGGPINEIGFSIDVDGSGNVYTTGQFENTSDFDPGLGTYYLTSFGGVDIFISKLDASGNFIWAKQIGGGPNHQYGYSIGVDSSENVYITGSLYGTSDFDPGSGTYNLTSFGTGDIFVSKLDASGNFLWAKQMGGINVENGNSIAIDGSGNVYTTGKFNSTSDFDPGPGTYYLTSFGDSDIYISLLDALGNFIWAKNMGGTSIDEGLSIEVDVNGYVYTIGYFVGTCDFDPGSGTYNLTSFGNNDIFILKLDASGNFVWAKQMGGTGYDVGRSIAVDDDWNVYTTGSFSDIGDFDPSSGIYNLTSIGNYDIYVSKLGQQPTNTYSYTNGLGFGTDINGNNWNIWSANGSNIWDWQSNYVNGYLHYSFKVFNYSGFYCSGSCRYHNIWSKNPNLGFELSDVMAHDISVFPENNQNNHIYQVNIQWNANGYNALVYDITSGTQYSDNDYTHPVNSNTYDSWTWGYSVWSNGTGYNDGEPNLHASQWTGNVYQDGPTGTIGGGGDIRTNALPVMQFGISSMPQNAIKLNGMQKLIADPIQLGTGTYTYSHLDFKIPSINGPLKFERFYNSLNSNLSETLGYGWSHSYNFRLINRQTAWDIQYPDGHLATFIPMNNSGQSFPIFSGTTDSLQKNANNSYSLFTKERLHYHFDQAGKLDSIIDLNNNITKLFYTGSNLDSILAPGDRSLVLSYASDKLISVRDPINRTCNYSYDTNSNLISVVGTNMDSTSFTYDSLHRMLTIVNPLGDTIFTNTYDSTGKVISQEDVYHYVTSIAYDLPNTGDATVTHPDNSQMIVHHDAFFRKTSEIDELNFTKTYTYDNNSNEIGFTNENNQSETRLFDSSSNLLSDTLPGGKITHVTYNNFNSPVQIIDANGNQKTFYLDSFKNNLDSILNADSSLLVFTYDSSGLVTQSIDGNGNTTSYSYSPEGDLLSIQTFAGIRLFTYDAVGRKVSSTDENGHTTNYVYDNNDNITQITDALSRTIINTYDANNQLLSIIDKNGNVTTYTYDKKGRKISNIDPKGGITTYIYDVRDNLISVTDPGNNVLTFTYDSKKRKISSTNALGITHYQYDAVGNLVKEIDPTNIITDYTYTPTNKKQSQKDGLNNITTFDYDLNENLISITDPLNRITTYGHDVKNRLVSVTDAMNQSTTIAYDYNDNKISVIDPNGHTQTYNYDAVDRLINYVDASGNNYNYSYDSVGNNLILTKPTGTITKAYDPANRVISINNSTGNNYTYTYDNNDNVITMSNNSGMSTMNYDSLNKLIQYVDPYNNTVSFTYDSVGNKKSIIYPGNKTVTYTYDSANNLISVLDWLNHTFTYSYDSSRRTSQLLYPNGISCQYGYDNAGRLNRKINRLSTDVIISGSTFNLDAVGNRISEQRLAQVPLTMSSFSRAYSYANDDNMLSDSIWNFTNDNSGNRTAETNGTDTVTYNFSVDNLLNNRIDTSGMNNIYTYDPIGHRISKTVDTNINKYVLDLSSSLSHVLQITDENGVVNSNYVYGHGLLEMIDSEDNPLFYHFDAQHNTVLLTDQDTVLKDTYTYDPFGTMLSHSGSTNQPYTFLGEFGVEQESQALYYARARYYDAVNGRFISKDDFDYDLNNPQTINRYVYGFNNPPLNYDPSGLFSMSSAGIASLQLATGFGNVALGALSFYGSAALSSILGPGAVLSGGSSFNDATKDFQAFNTNLSNALNSNDNYVSSDNFTGAFDFIYNDPAISAINKVYIIESGIRSIKELLKESPNAFAGILTSNYSSTQINSYLFHFFIGQNSPILKINDIREMIKTLNTGTEKLSISKNTFKDKNKCN